jgi:hypothetical protein
MPPPSGIGIQFKSSGNASTNPVTSESVAGMSLLEQDVINMINAEIVEAISGAG